MLLEFELVLVTLVGNLAWLPIIHGRKLALLHKPYQVYLLNPFSCPPCSLPSWITCNTSDRLYFLISTCVCIYSSIQTRKLFSLSVWGHRQFQFHSHYSIRAATQRLLCDGIQDEWIPTREDFLLLYSTDWFSWLEVTFGNTMTVWCSVSPWMECQKDSKQRKWIQIQKKYPCEAVFLPLS